jgi:RIO-like serine/threonine protein kinase
VHDHAITEEVPSALSASRRERASGFPSMIQLGRIGSYASAMSAGRQRRSVLTWRHPEELFGRCAAEREQQLVDEMNGEGFQVPPDAEPLEFLMAVMRDNTAAQYRHAKLGVAVTTVLNGQDFASLLEKAIERSQGVYEKVIEHHQTEGENRE